MVVLKGHDLYAQSTVHIGFISLNHYRHLFLFCFVFLSRADDVLLDARPASAGGRSSWLRPNKATTAPRHGTVSSSLSSCWDRGGLTPVRPSVRRHPYTYFFGFSISHVHQKSLKLAGRQMEKVTRPCGSPHPAQPSQP